jgi:2-amino-4-hydroxy-6-hydroxymethyldihydropteridine diphosphokinase
LEERQDIFPRFFQNIGMSKTAFIALGSNQGDRRDFLDRALQALQEWPGITVSLISSYHETEPVGGPPGQGKYLNAAAELRTELEPRDLLRALLEVEQNLGRVRTERDAPRTIDLDLLLYEQLVLDEPDLTVPHPRMHERLFVLRPLAEIAPRVVHPLLQRSIADLLQHAASSQLPEVLPAAPIPERSPRRPPGRELTGLRALVTGSTSGIGKAIALELAAGGADVLIHGRHEARANQVAQLVAEAGVESEVLLTDLRTWVQCPKLVEEAWETWRRIDIWINNAGADTLTGSIARWGFEDKLQELLAVDVTATILLSRAVGERMKAQGGGVLLNMGWDQAETGMAGESGQLFAASKSAIMAFSKSLALSLAPTVRVNCLAPGWIRTAWGEQASPAWQKRVYDETPLCRWGMPEDVAATARWLVSPAASYITGQVIRINGGAVR